MRVMSLASGSSGNATLVVAGATAVLIDAGLPIRSLVARLRRAGFPPERLTEIVLTHEHSDHISGALALAQSFGVPLGGDQRTLSAVLAALPSDADRSAVALDPHAVGTTWKVGALTVTSFAVPHDAVAPCGYLIGTEAWRVGMITDCGAMTDTILSHMRQANLVILESNHDREMLRCGPYPLHLKRRIAGPTGHLANDEAAEALHHCLDDAPRWIWLAHLSRTNNTPDLARSTATERLGARRCRTAQIAVAPPGVGPVWDSSALFEQAALL
jgi:phosphoribosyl 1,2-cyclic phosphodiesterase